MTKPSMTIGQDDIAGRLSKKIDECKALRAQCRLFPANPKSRIAHKMQWPVFQRRRC